MNIAYVSGGPLTMKASHIQIVEMCRALTDIGHNVALYLGLSGTTTTPPPFFPDWLEPSFPILPFYATGWGPRHSWQRLLRMLFHALQDNVDLIYIRESELRMGLLAGLLGIPCVIELHCPPQARLHSLILALLHRLPWCQLVVISHALKELCVRRGHLGSEKILVAHDAVALRLFQPPLSTTSARAALRLPVEGKLVVYAGGLQPGRGVAELLLACQGVAPLLVVGGAPDEVERLRQFAHTHGVQGVRFTGHVPHAQIPTYLYAADVLAMPYTVATQTRAGVITSGFMSPLKLYEYMAAQRPILATDLPALREVLQHKSNAYLVRPGDVADLRAGLQHLLQDEALAQSLARQARLDVETHTWEERARTIVGRMATHTLRRVTEPSPA